MNHHAAIVIGINHYQYFQPLSFAQQDAQQLHDFLIKDGGFSLDLCVEMSETSPYMADRSTYPTKENLDWIIDRICRHQLQPGDLLWFFFSGYGVTWDGEDYLMPIDGNPNDIPGTGISMRSLLETLKASPAKQVFVLLDANRATGMMNGRGMGHRTAELAKELEIPTVLSCQVDQFSRETAAVELGFFTSALLAALRTGCKTLDSLEQYLSSYLPQLSEQNFRPAQNPLWVVYPPVKLTDAVLPVATDAEHSLMTAVVEDTKQYINEAIAPTMTDEKISQPELPETPEAIVSESTNEPDANLDQLSAESTDEPDATPEAIALDQSHPTEEKVSEHPTPEEPEASSPTNPTEETNSTEEKVSEHPAQPKPDETANQPTTSVTPPKQKSKSSTVDRLLDGESKLWIPMVVVGVILILMAGIGLAKLNQFLDEQESDSPTSGNPTEPLSEPVVQDPPAAASYSTTPTASPTPEAAETSSEVTEAKPQPSASPLSNAIGEGGIKGDGKQIATVDLTPSVTQVTRPDNNRVVNLENAQASTFLAAIQTAQKVRPSEPNYPQAQENIQKWSQVILDIAKVRGKNGNFSDAIAAAKLVPNDGSDTDAQAQQLQDYLTEQLTLQSTYEKLLNEVDNSVTLGDASSYDQAIAKIRVIKEGQPLYRAARARIEWWSMRIWQIASDRAGKGQINLAIQTARLVPEDSQVYPNAQKALKEWQPD